jgi:hypothetical protein
MILLINFVFVFDFIAANGKVCCWFKTFSATKMLIIYS